MNERRPAISETPQRRLGKDLLSLAPIPAPDVLRLLQVARDLKAAPRQSPSSYLLTGMTLGLLFEKPSTRTRVSFEAGMNQLGGQSLFLDFEKIQLSRGESLSDTAQVLSRYLDGLVIRTFEQATLEEWARHTSIPVINGLTDLGHPCQALADLMTIWEKMDCLKGLKLAYIGDGNNVANSLLEASVKVGMHIAIGCPRGFEPDPHIVAQAQMEARQTGGSAVITHDPLDAANGADVVYTDVWTSMGQEQDQARRLTALAGYQVNDQLMNEAKPSAIVLHCLPAHRGEEITASVLDGPQSVVLDQAENRLHVQKAILAEWIGHSSS
ncbi:MAG: ornithine carbamoyltransferase [Nitrospirales bacterium]|nr:ornithine carbamoyltransferase [Nitrospirales bacterium]